MPSVNWVQLGVATIQAAIERGVTLIDTGDFYGTGHNEMLIGRAVQGRRDRVQISVKFGAQRGPDGSWLGVDTRSHAVHTSAAYGLERLGVDVIDSYRPARLDPNVPIEDTIGAIAQLVQKGYVRHATQKLRWLTSTASAERVARSLGTVADLRRCQRAGGHRDMVRQKELADRARGRERLL